MGLGLLYEVPGSHSVTHKHSVGLLWTRDRPVAETSTWQHTTPTRHRHPCPGGIRTRNHNKRAAADPRLRPRGHWCRYAPSNLAVFLLIAYSTLIPHVGRAIPFRWGTKSSDFMVSNLSVTLTSHSKYQSIDIQHRSLVAAEVRDRIYKQARLQNVTWIFVCAPGICWSRSSC